MVVTFDTSRCPISDLPRYSCYDCINQLHGKHVDLDQEMLKQTMGPAAYTDIVRMAPEPTVRLVEAQYDGECNHPDCPTGKFKATDKIYRDGELGWIHARHVL
jgi:hypothetical protein